MTLAKLPAPPEAGTAMRAADLINKFCLFRPCEVGTWPAKAAEYDADGNVVKEAQRESKYVECDVWVFDRGGILEEGTGVRVSWWRAVGQLEEVLDGPDGFVAGKPTQELGGRAIFLQDLEGDALKVAEEIERKLSSMRAADEFVDGAEVF